MVRALCVLLVALVALVGCAGYPPRAPISQPGRTYDPYARSDIDELLRFGADLAQRSGSSRAEECRMLLRREKSHPDMGLELHLMMGRILSDACGDISKILRSLRSMAPASIADQRVRWLVTIQTEALTRLSRVGASPKKQVMVGEKQKVIPEVAEPKSPDSQNNGDARILRQKLEAIRSIEKDMDKVSGGH